MVDFPFVDFEDEQLNVIEAIARIAAITGAIGMLVVTTYRRFFKK